MITKRLRFECEHQGEHLQFHFTVQFTGKAVIDCRYGMVRTFIDCQSVRL